MNNKIDEEFCILIYQDQDAKIVSRRIEMTRLSRSWDDTVRRFGTEFVSALEFTTPNHYYAGYCNLRNRLKLRFHAQIHNSGTIGTRPFWQMLADIKNDEVAVMTFFQDLCTTLLAEDNKLHIGSSSHES